MAIRSCQLVELAATFRSALGGDGTPAPLSGLVADGPLGEACRFVVALAVDAGEQLWASEYEQSGEVTSVADMLVRMGLPVALASPFGKSLREQLGAVRSALLGEGTPVTTVSSVRRAVSRVKVKRGRLRYRLFLGGPGVGPTVTLSRCDQRRHWNEICRFGGETAVFLQRLAAAMQDMTAYVSYKDTVNILVGEGRPGNRTLSDLAHDAVRFAIYRKLPNDVDRRDLVQSVRRRGYKICEGVDVTGVTRRQWDVPAWIRARKSDVAAGALTKLDEQALEMLQEGRSYENIKFELEIDDAGLEQLKARLEKLAKP